MIIRAIRRVRYAIDLRGAGDRPIGYYFPLWAKSDAVYVGRAGPGARLLPEADALARVIESNQVTDDELLRGVEHSNRLVAAYCLEALYRRSGSKLRLLTSSARSRNEKVTYRLACFAIEESIAERIKEYEKEMAEPGATDNPVSAP